jgi:uncharacterized integral membrane protein
MTRFGFIFLLIVTVLAIFGAAQVAERYAAPGMERTLIVAFITACVVFPAGLFAEKMGWVKGQFDITKLRSPVQNAGSRSAATQPDQNNKD